MCPRETDENTAMKIRTPESGHQKPETKIWRPIATQSRAGYTSFTKKLFLCFLVDVVAWVVGSSSIFLHQSVVGSRRVVVVVVGVVRISADDDGRRGAGVTLFGSQVPRVVGLLV